MTQYNADFNEGLLVIDNVHALFFANFNESLAASSSIHTQYGIPFGESLVVNEEMTSKGTFMFNIGNNINIKESHSLAFFMSIAEGINFTGNVEIDNLIAISFIEAISLIDDLNSNHKAIFALAEELSVVDDFSSGFGIDFLNAIGVTDSHDFEFKIILNILESITVSSKSDFSARLFFYADEGIDIADELASKGNLVALFEEGIIVGGLINTQDGLFEAWVVNTKTHAPYQYTNFPFNSFAMIGGKYYGADENGLFELDGDTDDGKAINSAIKTGIINFGTTLFKRIPRAYFGYTSDGVVLFKTISTESGKKIERWYELKEKVAEDTTNTRAKLARGVKSVHWQFELINVDGSAFNFDDIKLMPAILKRRR